MRKGILVTVLLLLGIFFIIATVNLFKNTTPTSVGEEVPDFTLETMDGSEVSLTEFRGKPMTLIFFTTWCVTCRQQAPYMKKFAEEHRDQIELVYIDRREPRSMVEEFIEEFEITSTVFLDQNDSQARRFGVIGQPEALFIDENGVLLHHIIGPMTDEFLVSKWKELGKLDG